MRYWIVKTEPESYSFQQLVKDKKTDWTGVRNYAARIHLRAMAKGDVVLVYHSMTEKALVGTATVSKTAFPDPTSNDPQWVAVQLKAGSALTKTLTLQQLKQNTILRQLPLVKIGRLSVSPVTADQYAEIIKLTK